jgi:hypothetical protein
MKLAVDLLHLEGNHMPTDPLYEALRPFHLWAQIAVVCAFLLAAAAFAVIAISWRLSRRWWLGIGIFALCLLAVVFGARSRGASYDLRPIAVSCLSLPGGSGCDVWWPWVTDAQQRVVILGVALIIGTVLGLAATIAALLLMRRSGSALRRLTGRVSGLLVAIVVAGWGAFQTANSVARWIETAYLADITGAGDGLGQLPLFEAIVGTIFGVIVLAIGIAAVFACSTPRRERLAQLGSLDATGEAG